MLFIRRHVQWLVLGNNQLSGAIPTELGILSSLEVLSLARNQLSGAIPAELRKLWPVVSKERHLLWVVGHQIDDRAKVTTGTNKVIRLEVRQAESV